MDVAELTVRVDTTDLSRGGAQMDAFTQKGIKAEKATDRLSRSAANANKATSRFGGHGLRMASMQLSQVAQQGAVTGNYLQALAIQLPDLTLGFGTIGIAAGVAAGALLPFVANLVTGADDAKAMDDALDSLAEAVKEYTSAADFAKQSTRDLREEFGSQAESLKATLDILQQIALSKALDSLNVSMGQLDTSRLRTLIDIVEEGRDEIAAFDDNFNRALAELSENFQITAADATRLLDAVEQMREAKGPEAIAESSRTLNALLLEIYGTVQDIPPEFRDMAESAARADVAASSIIGTMESVEAATKAASTAASDLVKQFLTMQDIRARFAGEEIVMGQDVIPTGLGDPDPDKPKAKRPNHGGVSAAQKEQNDQLREAERVFESTRTAAEAYAAEMADLNELHRMGYLDAETYARAVGKLDEELNAAKFESITQGIDGFSDSIGDAIVESESLGEAFSNMLKRMASDLLSSGISSLFTQSFGGFLGGLIPGFATGTSFAPGGLAMVGERGPELVNLPRGSQVYTAGQTASMMGGGGGVTINQSFSFAANGDETVKRIIQGEMPRIAESTKAAVVDAQRRGQFGGAF